MRERPKRTLLIDDIREKDVSRVARSYEDGLCALTQEGPWDILYLDHDLGDEDPKKTGYGIMCFLEQFPQYLPGQVVLVTANPVGRQNMQRVLNKLDKE